MEVSKTSLPGGVAYFEQTSVHHSPRESLDRRHSEALYLDRLVQQDVCEQSLSEYSLQRTASVTAFLQNRTTSRCLDGHAFDLSATSILIPWYPKPVSFEVMLPVGRQRLRNG